MQKLKIVSWTLKKEGSTRGKNWAIYEVIDSGGKKYGCFGSTLNASNVKANEEYLCEVESKKNGKFTNHTIKSISKPLNSVVAPNFTKEVPSNDKFGEIMGVLHEIQDEVHDIYTKLNEKN